MGLSRVSVPTYPSASRPLLLLLRLVMGLSRLLSSRLLLRFRALVGLRCNALRIPSLIRLVSWLSLPTLFRFRAGVCAIGSPLSTLPLLLRLKDLIFITPESGASPPLLLRCRVSARMSSGLRDRSSGDRFSGLRERRKSGLRARELDGEGECSSMGS